MKAIQNPQSNGSDPVLIRTWPDPNNPALLDPQCSSWINHFASPAHLGQRISYHIQSRFFQYYDFNFKFNVFLKE